MAAVSKLASDVGTSAACQALNMPRASYYRDRRWVFAPKQTVMRSSPGRALGPAEREMVLAQLHGERFQDRSPAAVYATLLDEGQYLCSIRTMYRVLEQKGDPANAATNSLIRLTRSRNFWLRLPSNSGVGTSPSCSDQPSGPTSIST